jgi:hypothetical protein
MDDNYTIVELFACRWFKMESICESWTIRMVMRCDELMEIGI